MTQWSMARTHARWDLEQQQLDVTKVISDVPKPLRDSIASELRKAISGEVRFDEGSRALYATDGSNYRQTPIGVVLPKNSSDIRETLAIARHFSAPVLARGGGTSLAGQCCNVAVVMDTSKYYNHLIEVDPNNKSARVEPGLILDHLRNYTKEKYELTFAPDPSTHDHCTLGGMIGNNSCGVHSMMSGRTSDNVRRLKIATYDGLEMWVGPTSEEELETIIHGGGRRGEIYARLKGLRSRYATLIRERYPKIPRRVSGYNLDDLLPENGFNVARALVGSEGTCVTILEAELDLIEWPKFQSVLILGYSDIFEAGDHIPAIRQLHPIGLEGFDENLIDFTVEKGIYPDARKMLPEGKGWIIVEFGGNTKAEADAKVLATMAKLSHIKGGPTFKWFDDKEQEEQIWKIRESGLAATARVPNGKSQQDTWPGWEDSAVHPDQVGDYLRELRKLFDRYEYKTSLYGHFGQGCVHVRIPFDLYSAEGIRKYRSFMDDASTLVIQFGGSLSGEHGDGQARAEFLPKMFGEELIEAFREFKSIWDPEWKMNPGKIVNPRPIDSDLRLGTDYQPPILKTHFKFPDDEGSFSRATLRCVGVGTCRRTEGGIMCPSFKITREEKDTTRGRARLFHEMLTSDVLQGQWKNEAVKEALDLCLACKGCKKDCPVNVDMATYKSEFLSHYYEGRIRPRAAYAMGLIDQWARLASNAPELVNFVSQNPGLKSLAKMAGGIAQKREIPKFPSQTFKDWFFSRSPRKKSDRRIFLWADTFTNYLEPWVARSAVQSLETLGYEVLVSQKHICCGRPLYDYGFLDLAKSYLHKTMTQLRPAIEAGIPIVGLEPSCMAVFKDEMQSLLPHDENARRLKNQTFMFADFVKNSGAKIPRIDIQALVQGHCHHKSVLGFDADKNLMEEMGIDFEILEEGCCGMAGSFGFESESGHYDLSIKIAKKSLLPKIENSRKTIPLIADGFSCRHQIKEGSGRRAHHIAELVNYALNREKRKNS